MRSPRRRTRVFLCSIAGIALTLVLAPSLALAQSLEGEAFRSAAADELTGAAAVSAPPRGFVESAVFSGLAAPTTVRFAPDGHVFVAEKAGRVLEYDSLSDPTATVFADLRTAVYDYEDRGLLSIAIDPRYASGSPYVYVLYTYDKDPFSAQVPRWNDDCPTPPGPTDDGCLASGRLSRLSAGGTEQVLITDWCQQYTSHSIGDLAFGPDGALYVSSGDGASYTFADYGQDGAPANPCDDPPGARGTALTPPAAEGGALRSQDSRTTGDPTGGNGTILRVDPDTGAARSDNPNVASSDPMTRRIVAQGLRNPFRIAVRPGTEELWLGDVGWTKWEEINRIPSPTTEVRNFGWPCYEGAAPMSSYDNAGLNLCESLYAQGAGAHSGPHYTYAHADRVVPGEGCEPGGSSVSGIAFYSGMQFPARYRDGLFFADYVRSCIWFMPLGSNGLPDPAQRETFATGAEGVVGLTVGPDGSLYYPDIISGEIKRISFPSANTAPTADAVAVPTSGATPLTVQFDGRGSSDPNGDALTYAWDLDGDGAFDDSSAAQATWTYTTPGFVGARLRVTDTTGLEGIDTVTVTAGTPPTARIDTPATGFTWAVGDQIDFAGGGSDGAGAPLAPASMTWRLLFQHCAEGQPQNCHTHSVRSWNGIASGSVIAPDHEYPSYLELELTVTDANGLTGVVRRRMDPRIVDLTFETRPAGLQLSVGSFSAAAPFTRVVIVGSTQTVSAPAPQQLGAGSYGFGAWSDGGAQSHSITAPPAAASYRADFATAAPQTAPTAAPAGSGITARPAPDGLVAAYGFGDGSGAKVADGSGAGNPGVISGATRTRAGRIGGALQFDGVNDWVTVADSASLDLTKGMTLESWVYPTALGSPWRTVLLKERRAGLAYALYARDDRGRPGTSAFNGSERDTRAPGALRLNAWTHLAATYGGKTLRLFVNGEQIAARKLGKPLRGSADPLRIGGNAVWNEWFQGRIDEVRVYDRALGEADIQADMTRPVSAPGGQAGARLTRLELRSARRRSSLRRERARRDLPLRSHDRRHSS